MTETYLNDDTYRRLIDVILDNLGGKLSTDIRDKLMFALGDEAGVWPESSRLDAE